MRSYSWLAAGALLVLMLFLAGGPAMHESATVDEISHIGSGLSYLQKLDLRLNPEHPPLAKAIAAIPLALRGTSADYGSAGWKLADNFFTAYFSQWLFGDAVAGRWNAWGPTVHWPRVPMLLMTLLLGWLLYRYATHLGSLSGGLLCLALYVSTPAFLVFGPLVLTDVPVTLCMLFAVWRLAELWNNPSRRNSLIFALGFAGCLLTKFTGLFLFPITLALFLQTRFFPTPVEPVDKEERKRWRNIRWMAVLRSTLWTFGLVYLVYLILSWNQPDSPLNALNAGPVTHVLRRILMPVWLYTRGLLLMVLTGARSTYLFGQAHAHGLLYYFPVVVALKSTLGFLMVLVVAAVALALTRPRRKRGDIAVVPVAYRSHWRVLLITFWFFLAACVFSQLQISIRHFLVPLLMLILLLSPLPQLLGRLRYAHAWQYGVAALALFSIVSVVIRYPNFFPYTNALAFGKPAYWLMNDSNVSWNGALPDVEVFVRQHQLSRVNLDWASLSDPAIVVPEAQPWDCQAPTAEDAGRWSVVSAVSILENHNCGWLQPYPHEAIAGGEMYAFLLPSPIPAAGMSGGPPLPSQRRNMWGTPFDIRSFAIDLMRHPQTAEAKMQELVTRMRTVRQPKTQGAL